MPRKANPVPSYLFHKPTGQAYTRISGRCVYLGRWDSPESKAEYRRILAELPKPGPDGTVPPLPPPPDAVTVAEVLVAYLSHAKSYYTKNGTETSEMHCIRAALRPVRELFAHTPAGEFTPARLRQSRDAMVAKGWCRKTVNKHVHRVRRAFRWAVEHELVPAHVLPALDAVGGLKAGRTAAPESDPVKPVPAAVVEKTLTKLRKDVAGLVRFQLLTGCRPGEACALRWCDIDRTGDVWRYTPESHKTEHHGKGRVILIGPRGQELLLAHRKWRPVADAAPVFSTKTGRHFLVENYRMCVARACDRLGIPRWFPHQLRHLAATEIGKAFGLETARTVLGHASVSTTTIYAERDTDRAAEAVRRVG